MENLDATVIGAPAHRRTRPGEWTLFGLGRGERRSLESAMLEAQELLRALLAHTIVTNADAGIHECEERMATLQESVAADRLLLGFSNKSSPGAYVIGRIAVAWTPPTRTQFLDHPLGREALSDALVHAGLSKREVRAILGDFTRSKDDFVANDEGLDLNTLCALAEGTLSTRERDDALGHVAISPRCLARFATIAQVILHTRTVLPLLPPTDLGLGAGYDAAVAAFVFGAPSRVLDLVGYNTTSSALRVLFALARARLTLSNGEPLDNEPLSDRAKLVFDDSVAANNGACSVGDTSQVGDAMEDILGVDESVVQEGTPFLMRHVPRIPEWSNPGGPSFDHKRVAAWWARYEGQTSIAGQLRRVLGLRPLVHASSLPPIPPDGSALSLAFEDPSSSDFVGPILAMATHALSIVMAAAGGRVVSADAVARSGDLSWLMRRARVLALLKSGDVERAAAEVALEPDPSPEMRLATSLAMRAPTRRPQTDEAQLRLFFADLVGDLGVQTFRTIARTT